MASTNVGSIHYDLSLKTDKFDRAQKGISSKLSTLGDKMIEVGKTTAKVGLAMGALAVVIGVKTNAELETATLQFETLMGSAEKAKKHVASLFDFAKKTPFETQPIINASLKLQTFGGAALNTSKNLKLVGDAAAATNANIEEVAFWVGRAYAMIEAGKPFGEAAMRLQELAVLSPKARAEMEKLQESGASSKVVFAALQKELGKFNGAMEKQANTLKGLWSTFMDVVKLDLGFIFEPLFKTTKKALAAIIAFADSPAWDRIKKRARDAVGRVAESLNRIIDAFNKGGFKAAMQQAGKEFEGFAKAAFEALQKIDWSGMMSKVINTFLSVIDKVPWEQYSNLFSEILLRLMGATNWVTVSARGIPILVKAINETMTGVLLGVIQWAKDDPIGFLTTLAAIIFTPVKFIGAIGAAISKVPIVGSILAWLLSVVNKLGGPTRQWFHGLGQGMINSLRGGLDSVILRVWLFFDSVKRRIFSFFAPATSWLVNAGRNIVRGLANGISSVAGAVWNAVKRVSDQIGRFFRGAGSWLYNTGRAIIQGLINGLSSMAGAVYNKAQEIADGVKNRIQNALKIHSPSRVFFGFGQNVVQGFVDGINKSKMAAYEAMDMVTPVSQPVSQPASHVNNNHYTINLEGIIARSRGDLREIGKDIISAVNEELRAKSIKELGR